MTVSTTTSRADYTGNGVTTAFAVPFYFLDSSHLLVLRTQISTGTITTLALGTDYTVSGAGVSAGGTITMAAAPTADQKLSILRNVPLTQLTHYVENDPFPAASHERALDQLTMELQQVGEAVGRALTLAKNTPSSAASTELPTPASNKLIAWNQSANGLQNVDPATLATIVAFGTAKADIFNGDGTATQFALTANPGALNNLDVSISGVTQKPGIDYTWVSGTTITFTAAPPAGTDNVLVRYLQGLPQGYADSAASTYSPAGAGAQQSTVQAKLRESKSLNDYTGATANDKAAAMIADAGFLRLTTGEYTFTTATIDAPIYFEPGAYITVPSGNTLTITNTIESTRQWIFRGSGDYVFNHDADSGENARHLHVSWFGVFPNGSATDCSAKLNKIYAAVGNLRESVIDYDIGTYGLSAGVTVTRGAHTSGAGTRRTVFRLYAEGFDAFTTSESAAKFSDIQFENSAGIGAFNGAYVKINHGECEVYDVNVQASNYGVYVAGTNCRVDNIMVTGGVDAGAGSSAVRVTAGNCSVSNVLAGTSTIGHAALVHIGGAATVANTRVSNVSSVMNAIPVLVDATSGSVSRGEITGVRCEPLSSAECIVKFVTGVDKNIADFIVTDIVGSAAATSGLKLQQNSTGAIYDTLFDNITVSGTTGNCFEFARTAGSIYNITVGSTVISDRATPYSYTGTNISVEIAPTSVPNALPGITYDLGNLAANTAASVDLRRSVFSGIVMVSGGSTEYGMFVARAASSPAVTQISGSANMATALTALTGTTGTAGKLTLGVTDGVLYVENRTAGTLRVNLALLSGA